MACDDIHNQILYAGLQSFTARALSFERDLFRIRSALIDTPTANLPSNWIAPAR